MCGRIVTFIPGEELAKIFALIETPLTDPRYNVAPTQNVGVIRAVVDSPLNRYSLMKWGLAPSWSKEATMGSHMINARSETVAEKPAFRNAIKYQRCIIPVNGFYEWSHEEGQKRPHYIHLSDFKPMGLAGIWEHWKNTDGEILETFSILTTAANKLIEPLHDRMPVLLKPTDYQFWLNRNMHDPYQLETTYKPYPAEEMAMFEVPTLVNNARFDSPACIVKV